MPEVREVGPAILHVDYREDAAEAATTPRVLVVYPGHRHATKDVADNILAGLLACGVEAKPFPYHTYLEAALAGVDAWSAVGFADPHGLAIQFASAMSAYPLMAWRPDLVVFVTGHVFPMAHALTIGQYTRTAVILTESPYQWETESRLATAFNYAFTNERAVVDRLIAVRREYGHPHPERVAYLPHMYDPERHFPREEDDPAYRSDVCFIGSPFPERQALFGGVDWTGIDFLTRGVLARDMDELTDAAVGFVENDETHRFYAGAQIVVNHHRTVRYFGHDGDIAPEEAESLNPRVYELAAAGCFQVCDDSRPELVEVFGETVPTYRAGDSADLERVLRYYLARPDERQRLAALAYERVQAHSCHHRMRAVLACVFGAEPGQDAPESIGI